MISREKYIGENTVDFRQLARVIGEIPESQRKSERHKLKLHVC